MIFGGDDGDDGGEDSCVGGRSAKRALFAEVGGGVLCWMSRRFGDRSLLKEEYGLL